MSLKCEKTSRQNCMVLAVKPRAASVQEAGKALIQLRTLSGSAASAADSVGKPLAVRQSRTVLFKTRGETVDLRSPMKGRASPSTFSRGMVALMLEN